MKSLESLKAASLPAEPAAEQEAARLRALRRYDILDTPPDGAFDRITAIAAELFDVPVAIVSLVDEDRIWFKSHHGLDINQIGKDPGLCASATLQDDAWVVTDAARDPRTLANPLVAGEFGLRFYVGAPLRTRDGHKLGTLCVIDRTPRTVTTGQIGMLEHLAATVMDQMELRLSAHRALAAKDAALQRANMLAKEIDHRVKNSLQLASALLNLQSRSLGETEGSRQLALAASRISAIGRVHHHLYASAETVSVDAGDFLTSFCLDLSGTLGGVELEHQTCTNAEARIDAEHTGSLGLILNELVTNAAKNGASRIAVSLRAERGGCLLSVADDGRGFPDGFDPATSAGLGMRVVRELTSHIGGSVEFGGSERLGGAEVTIAWEQPREAQ